MCACIAFGCKACSALHMFAVGGCALLLPPLAAGCTAVDAVVGHGGCVFGAWGLGLSGFISLLPCRARRLHHHATSIINCIFMSCA